MHAMLQQEKPDDYVIGTGKAHSVAAFLCEAITCAGLDLEKYKAMVVSSSKTFSRANDLHALVADYSKARRVLSWEPKVTFAQLVEMMVNSDVYGGQCV